MQLLSRENDKQLSLNMPRQLHLKPIGKFLKAHLKQCFQVQGSKTNRIRLDLYSLKDLLLACRIGKLLMSDENSDHYIEIRQSYSSFKCKVRMFSVKLAIGWE